MLMGEKEMPVHVKHADGFPLCWIPEQQGTFAASWDEGDVTCPECIKQLGE